MEQFIYDSEIRSFSFDKSIYDRLVKEFLKNRSNTDYAEAKYGTNSTQYTKAKAKENESKEFMDRYKKDTNATSAIIKGAIATVGISVAIKVIPTVISVLMKRYGQKAKDQLLYRRNERLNKLFDKYSKDGSAAEVTPASVS